MAERPLPRIALGLASLILAGCASYTPRPLEAGDPVARYYGRSLLDPDLRMRLDSVGAAPEPAGWRDWQLGAAAWFLRPVRDRVRAEIAVAEAARVSAGGRPNPDLNTETEFSFSGSGGGSRLGQALSALLTVQTGGKRGARLARAGAGVLLAQARASEEGWALGSDVRVAFTARVAARRIWEAAVAELGLTDTLLGLMRARYETGTISAGDVARSEADRQAWAAEVAGRRREVRTRDAALAGAVGVSGAELNRLALLADTGSLCHRAESRTEMGRLALTSRPEIHRLLAEYQVAEADLRVEVANSWPDLALGPGLFFDHGVNKWTIAFSLPSLPVGGNRGPIGEAEARRAVVAGRVGELHERVLAEVETAQAGCAAAREELEALDVSGLERRRALVEAAYQRGESGRLEVAIARLELARARRRKVEVEAFMSAQGVALEHVLGVWTGMPPRLRAGEGPP